jgi:hypothetical protein
MSQIIKSFNGKSIRVREDDQYFCLTDMAQAVDKRVNNWSRLESTRTYLSTLSSVTQIPVTGLVSTIQGGFPELQGTWAHKMVALEFARWCSPEFAIQCNMWVEELMANGKVELVPQKPKSSAEMLVLYAEQFLEHEQRLLKIEEENQKLLAAQEEIHNIVTIVEDQVEEFAQATEERLIAIEVEQDRHNTPAGHKYTVLGYARLQGLELSNSSASVKGRKATRLCRERGIEVEQIHDPRYGYVGLYPESLLREVFAD